MLRAHQARSEAARPMGSARPSALEVGVPVEPAAIKIHELLRLLERKTPLAHWNLKPYKSCKPSTRTFPPRSWNCPM